MHVRRCHAPSSYPACMILFISVFPFHLPAQLSAKLAPVPAALRTTSNKVTNLCSRYRYRYKYRQEFNSRYCDAKARETLKDLPKPEN